MLRPYLPPFLAGLSLIIAFPPFEQGWWAWFALVPLVWFCLQAGVFQAFWGGFLFGLPLQFYLNFYLSNVLFAYLPPALAVAALMLVIVYSSLFYGLFALAVSYTRWLKSPLQSTAIIPALWVLMEYARSSGFAGYSAGYLGYTQWHYPASLNLAAAFGYWGLSFVMVYFQSILLLGLRRTLRGKGLIATALVFLALFCGGVFLPEQAPIRKETLPLQTALIQGCSHPDEILSNGKKAILQRYLELTRAVLEEEPGIELVLWPETVVTLRAKKDGTLHHQEMVQLADELKVDILYGAQLHSGGKLYNSMVLLLSEQNDIQIYRKQRLVPFVEYFPLGTPLSRLLNLDFSLGGYRAGDELTLFNYRRIPLAGAICFESYFGNYTRRFAQKGGLHLFIATNDVWFGKSIGLEQHAQVAALRAAEMGIGVTQVANSGISISFDCRGRELMRTGKGERGSCVLPLYLDRRSTFYRTAGDFFPLLCFLMIASATVPAWRNFKSLSPPPTAFRRRKNR